MFFIFNHILILLQLFNMGNELANKATAVSYVGKRNNIFEAVFLAEFHKNKSGNQVALIFSPSVNAGVC